jgi:hypothetical protein
MLIGALIELGLDLSSPGTIEEGRRDYKLPPALLFLFLVVCPLCPLPVARRLGKHTFTMSMQVGKEPIYEKEHSPDGSGFKDHTHGRQFSLQGENADIVEGDVHNLHRGLNGFHTSMIAIGGAIGAGLFVGAGSAFANGGPASVLIGFIIISVMMVCVMQALGELATLYPQNGKSSRIQHLQRALLPVG